MRIGPNPTCLRIVIIFSVLFAAGCADFEQQSPLSFGNVQIAERSNHHPTIDRSLQIWMRVARQAIENGHPDTAIRFAQKAVMAFPESDEPLRILALAYRQKNGDDKVGIVARATAKPDASARPSKAYSIEQATKSRMVMAPTNIAKNANASFVPFSKRIPSSQPVVPRAGKLPAYRIQLAAYFDLHDAVRGKDILTRRLPNNFPPLGIFVRHRPAANGKRVNYRLRSRDLTNRSQARTFCKAVKAVGLSCLPIRQTSSIWQLVRTDGSSQVARAAGSGPKVKHHFRADVAMPARKPVAITARRSLVRTATSALAARPKGRLFRIQLAAYSNLARAVRGKQILSKSLPDNFPRLEILQKIGNAEPHAPINYWVRSHGLWHKGRARAHCDQAQSAGHACFLVKTDSTMWRPIVANG